MKLKRKSVFSYILTAVLAVPLFLSLVGCGGTEKTVRSADIAVLYTGDVHCAVDENIGYAGLAAFKSELETEGAQVLLADTGDAIKGAPIGSLSEGSLPIEIMNRLGYCAYRPGKEVASIDKRMV